MVKGFITGSAWGVVVSGVTLSVASLLAEAPAGNLPPATPLVEAPGAVAAGGEGGPVPKDPAVMSEAPTLAEAPQVDLPGPEGAPPLADVVPAPPPVAAAVEGSMAEPETGTAPEIAATVEAPVLPSPQSVAPEVPSREDDLAVSVQPAEPADPAEEQFLAVAPDAAPDAAPPAAQTEAATPAAPGAEVTMAVPSETVPPVVSGTPKPASAPAAETATPVAPDTAAPAKAPQVAQAAPAEPATPAKAPEVAQAVPAQPADPAPQVAEASAPSAPAPDALAPDAQATAPADPAPQTVQGTEPVQGTGTSSGGTAAQPRIIRPQSETIGEPVGQLPKGTASVRILRPGSEPVTDGAAAADPTAPAPEVSEDAPALVRYGIPFENPAGLPLLAVVLVDDGSLPHEAVALSGIPFPITVALDPSLPDAKDRAEAYRAAGLEVVAMPRLPEGARPEDVEVTYEAAFSALPQAVAVLDAGQGGLQAARSVTDQAMANLGAAGRGLLTNSRGLNMAARAAEAAGVPSATVYRDLDDEDQDARTIRRFLDQAAFRARQQSGVVLLGHIRPDTISALILWGTAERAGQVALAPLSAVLRAGQP